MSNEIYYIEEISEKSDQSSSKTIIETIKDEDEDALPTMKRSQELRLHEIELQLEMAESRCNTLKGQVDYMKMLYTGTNAAGTTVAAAGVAGATEAAEAAEAERAAGELIELKESSNLILSEGPATAMGVTGVTAVPAIMVHPEPSAPVVNVFSKKNVFDLTSKSETRRGKAKTKKDMLNKNLELNFQTISTVSTVTPKDNDTRAAVKSINNIISGMTNSVNRLVQLQAQQHGKTDNTSDHADKPSAAEKPYQVAMPIVEVVEIVHSVESVKSTTKKKKERVKASAIKLDSTTCENLAELRKKPKLLIKPTERKSKFIRPQPSTNVDNPQATAAKMRKKPLGKTRTVSSRAMLSMKSSAKLGSKSQETNEKTDLIELYHNSAAKIKTSSEDSLPPLMLKKPVNKTATTEIRARSLARNTPQVSQHLPISNEVPAAYVTDTCSLPYKPPLSPITETVGITREGNFYRNNYELPTIASKMKQVAKNYFQNFSFRTIPFVAAKSTTPSHNLGVNIQQVLSIIKGRKPISGISPTLAYNIELAATKLSSRPLSALVSTLGSRIQNYRTCPTPVPRRRHNFSNLHTLAKEIPEETLEELNSIYEEETMNKVVQGGAGDKDLIESTEQDKTWYSENETEVSVKDSKYKQKVDGVKFHNIENKLDETNKKTRVNKPWNPVKKAVENVKEEPLDQSKSCQISKREKSLKEVLRNLHNEFACLNDRYDELKTEVNNVGESNSSLLNELDKMEKDLQHKEDEITMVMSLYKEVLGLKQQVKLLKKRASNSGVIVNPFTNRTRDYKDMNAAGHLTKLLRHIQQFQETLRTKPNF